MTPALADGGGAAGVSGGVDSLTGAGGPGGNAGLFQGGGGGGAGATGGVGGQGHNQVGTTPGGPAAGAPGTDGASGDAGSGGGGGAHGSVGGLPVGITTGGKGGNGGDGSAYDGGGGGGGGFGTVVTSGGALGTLSVNVTGGAGGNGGFTALNGGSGGSGGVGLVVQNGASLTINSIVAGGVGGIGRDGAGLFGDGGNGGNGGDGLRVLSGATVTNLGSIIAGDGGAAGIGQFNGTQGTGGVGVEGSGFTIINAGTISGGANAGGGQANAITFTGGTNVLELQSGSSISGNVVAGGATDTLRLGGTTDSSFDVSTVGAAAQYQGFEGFAKTGTSTWTLTVTNAGSTPWTITQGTLSIAADGALGATSGVLAFNGGTLATTATFSSSRNMTFALFSSGRFDVATGTTLTLDGTLSGSGGINLTGGMLVLSGANSFDGSISVNGGMLVAASAGALGSTNGGTTINNGSNLTIDGVAIGTEFIRLAGGSALTGRGMSSSAGDIALAATSTITVDAAGVLTLSGTIGQDGPGLGITKAGAGTLVLSGANTYTGTTTISVGTLQVQNNSALGAGAIIFNGGTLAASGARTLTNAIQLNAAGLVDAAGNTFGLSGNITGLSGISFSSSAGLASVVVSGNNTYSGTTSIAAAIVLTAGSTTGFSSTSDYDVAGTLALAGFSNSIQSLSGAGNVSNNNAAAATLTIATVAPTTTFSGAIEDGAGGGALSLLKTGVGTQALIGANTFTGTTTVDGGKLAVRGAGSLTSPTITVNTGGVLESDGSANGGGGLGTGAAITVNAGGNFQLTGPDEIGSLAGAGDVLLGDDLTTGSDNTDTAFSGNTAGPGELFKSGTGRMTVSGTLAHNGGSTVNDGVLEIGATGVNMLTATVNGGGLVVNGTSGGVTVNGGYLGGIGNVGPTQVLAGGTLAPGNSIGTITVNGNLVFNAGSTYAVEVSPSAADRVNVTGTATLTGATVATTYAAGAYIQRQYTIVNATGGIVGTFDGLTGTAPTGFAQSLTYDANNAYLVLTLLMSGGGGAGGPSGPGPYGNLNQNQIAVAGAITQSFIANGGILAAFGALDAYGLTQVSGEIASGAMGAGFGATGQFVNLIGEPGNAGGVGASSTPLNYAAEGQALGYAADVARAVETERRGRVLSSGTALAALAGTQEDAAAKAATALAMSGTHSADIVERAFASRWKLWGAAYGGGERVVGNGTVGSATLTASTWGVASGVTRSFEGGSLGVALGGAGTGFSLANGLGGGTAASFNAGVHGTVDLSDAAYLSGALAYGYHATVTTRNVPGDTLTGRFGAHTFGGRVEAGYRLRLGGMELTPYAAAEATAYRLPAYMETSALGGPFALAFGARSQSSVRTELGARTAIELGSGVTLTGRAAWVWNAQNGRAVSAAFQALPGFSFTVNGAQPARHAALVDLGIDAALSDSVSAKLSFTGEFSRNVTSYGATGKLSVKW